MTPERGGPEDDLRLTLRELSNTYEELSLLYRLSEKFSGNSVDEMCRLILDEVTGLCETSAAALVFVDEKTGALFTKDSRGQWDKGLSLRQEEHLIRSGLEGKSACRRGEGGADAGVVLVCPLKGKKKTIGALVVVGVYGKEFYSNELKLLHAVSSQAALFMENAFLYEEMEAFFLSATSSYVRAIEATSRWTAGHTERVTGYALGIGVEMGLDEPAIGRLRTSGLLHDIGKIAVRTEVLDKREGLIGDEWEEIKKHPRVGAEILEKIKAFEDVAEAVRYHHERWDGSGPSGLKGTDIPLMARILSVADAFDAMTSDRPYRPGIPDEDAARELIANSGIQFDPDVVNAFERWRQDSGIQK